MSCDVGEATESLENELIFQPFRCFTYVIPQPSERLELSLQPFRNLTYVTADSSALSLLYLRHSSFSNPSVASPTSFFNPRKGWSSFSNLCETSPTPQLILQPFRRFTYITAHYRTLPLIHLCHSSFSNPSFAFPTSQALHLRHLLSHPWPRCTIRPSCDISKYKQQGHHEVSPSYGPISYTENSTRF